MTKIKRRKLRDASAVYGTAVRELAFTTCLATGSAKLAARITASLGAEHVHVEPSLARLTRDMDCSAFIVDTKVRDFDLWPAPLLLLPESDAKPWIFLVDPGDVEKLSALPRDSILCQRDASASPDITAFLHRRLDPDAGKRLAKVNFLDDRRAFVVEMDNGKVYLLPVSDLPGAEETPVTRWAIARERRSFTLTQASGNRVEVPWDAVLYHCDPEYPYYKGRADLGGNDERAEKIGERVRVLRESEALSVTDLAERVGMQRSNLSRLEHGRHLPSLETLERIAEGLGVPVARLVAQP